MAKKIGTETVHVIRKVKTDRLATPPVDAPAEHDIEGCAIAPRTSFETGKGWVIVDGRMVAAPYGADIQADDLVTIPDSPHTWQVDGVPGPYKNKRGKEKATIFYLKRQGTS